MEKYAIQLNLSHPAKKRNGQWADVWNLFAVPNEPGLKVIDLGRISQKKAKELVDNGMGYSE